METLGSQWKRIQKSIYNAAYRKSYAAMENQTKKICLRFRDIIKSDSRYTGMTGNSATGLAVGLYRDGELLAYSTMMEAGEAGPITHVLTKNEKFKKGELRYDNSLQENTTSYKNSGANSPYYAWRRAVNKLRRTRPSYKGYTFVVVHGAHYLKFSGYDNAMTDLYADLRSSGAKLMSFHLRNT